MNRNREYELNKLIWIEELLPFDVEAVPKHGGMAYYHDAKLVMILVENDDGFREYKNVEYPFEIWNGCILPIEKNKQNAFFLKLPLMENHPANKNWLYLPAETETFEEDVKLIVREITKRNPLLGIPVKFSGLKKIKDPEAPKPMKKVPNQVKADKKKENAFLMGMLSQRKK